MGDEIFGAAACGINCLTRRLAANGRCSCLRDCDEFPCGNFRGGPLPFQPRFSGNADPAAA